MMENHAKTVKEQTKEESKKKCGIMVGKSVSQHFHLYMVRSIVFPYSLPKLLFQGKCFLSFDVGGHVWHSSTLVIWLSSQGDVQVWRVPLSPCCRLFHLSPSWENYLLEFYARWVRKPLLYVNRQCSGFTVFCVILNLMEFKYLCYLFFKARVKLTSTARTSAPLMPPKPPTYPGPYPAYEPLGKG